MEYTYSFYLLNKLEIVLIYWFKSPLKPLKKKIFLTSSSVKIILKNEYKNEVKKAFYKTHVKSIRNEKKYFLEFDLQQSKFYTNCQL